MVPDVDIGAIVLGPRRRVGGKDTPTSRGSPLSLFCHDVKSVRRTPDRSLV